MRVKVRGTKQLTKISAVLESKGNSRALKRRMAKAFREASKPIIEDQHRNLLEDLPKSGGANRTIAGESHLFTRTSFTKPTVDIIDSWPGHDMKAINEGRLRHPLFKNRRHWYTTPVPALMLTIPFLEHKRTVQGELLKSMDSLAEEIARET